MRKRTAVKTTVATGLAGLAMAATVQSAAAEDIKLRIASGHAAATPYVNLMQSFFVPEVTKRVKERTKHTVEFIEGYGGAMVKVADTLEGVQSGIIDIGGYCMCFEPSNLPLHAFQAQLPFGPMSAVTSLAVARTIYDQVPFMTKNFEDKFGQTHLAIIADNGYNLMTSFEWNNVSELKGRKIGGAGINLKWLEYVGAVPVQTSAPEVYTSIQTGVFQGMIIFPSIPVNLKWYEVAKHYTLTDFGSVSWHALTMNKNKFSRMPKEVQDIVMEVAREFELKTGTVNEEMYPKQLETLKSFGVTVKAVPDSVKLEWAKSLAGWPQERVNELSKNNLPAAQVFNLAIAESEKKGHKWPVRYEIKASQADNKK
jgi:C4-dicarboxylate-binding protein DctP